MGPEQSPQLRMYSRSLFGSSFWLIFFVLLLWINASEIFRYFVFVLPMIRDAFQVIENVAPINLSVFVSWMIWDTVLVGAVLVFVWIYLDRFGEGWRNAVIAGTLIWTAIFGLLWLGLLNMNLATINIAAIALSLSWVEMAVSALIVNWGRNRFA